jgi:hypothetical protein
MLHVLDDKQGGRPILKLLAPGHTDVNPLLPATLANTLGLGQFVMHHLAWQVRGQTSSAVWPGASLGWGRRLRGGWRRCLRSLVEVVKQAWLVGVEAFGLTAVEALQQSIHTIA